MTYSRQTPPTVRRDVRRRLLRWSDALSARPVAALVFAASVLGFGALVGARGGQAVDATGVAWSPTTQVETLLDTTVSAVHVLPGDTVAPGALLVTLDGTLVARRLDAVEREIGALDAQLELERAQGRLQTDRLALDHAQMALTGQKDIEIAQSRRVSAAERVRAAQIWREDVARLVRQGVEPQSALWQADQGLSEARAEQALWTTQARGARGRAAEPADMAFDPSALEQAQLQLTRARREQLAAQRRHLQADAASLEVRAPIAGRIGQLATVGARTSALPALAEIIPLHTQEVVAYLPSDIEPHRIPAQGAAARLVGCAQPSRVVRVGAGVTAAPGQVRVFGLPGPVHGLPVYLEAPLACHLVPGTLTHVEIGP